MADVARIVTQLRDKPRLGNALSRGAGARNFLDI
jgi:hypothetical protein